MAFNLPPPPAGNDITGVAWQGWFYTLSTELRKLAIITDKTQASVGGGGVAAAMGSVEDMLTLDDLCFPVARGEAWKPGERGQPGFAQDGEDGLDGIGVPGRTGPQGIPGPAAFALDGEDGGEWIVPPGNTPPPANSTGLEIRQEVTGTLQGGLLTATAGGATFSISDGFGQIVDTWSDPMQPKIKQIRWTGKSGIADGFLGGSATYVTINEAGAVQQYGAPVTQDLLRTELPVGRLIHGGGVIQNTSPTPVTAYQNGYLAQDLLAALGTIVNGCAFSGGTGLTIARASGSIFRRGAHYSADLVTPNEVPLAAVNPSNLETHCRNGSNTVFSASAIGTTLTCNVYDNGAVAASGVPSGAVSTNSWQAMRMFLSPTGVAIFQYGQATYNSLANAQSGVAAETFYEDPVLQFTAFRGYLFVRGGATDLSNSGDALFQGAGKLGDISGGGGATGSIGPTGPQGVQGPVSWAIDGEDGQDGISVPGVRGLQGLQGPPGFSLDGADGEESVPIPGRVGITGATGSPGPAGPAVFLVAEEPEEVMSIPGPAGASSSLAAWVLPFAAAHG